MRLLIHIGLYKTGSSYLQYLSFQNREFLSNAGIYFPESEFDKKMADGLISPGNGFKISKALREKNLSAVKKILGDWIVQAKVKNCKTVLISCEDLIHPFSKDSVLENFDLSCKDCDIDTVEVFGFVRDFDEHAISTYKHRGKYGALPDFKAWLRNAYETIDVLYSITKKMNSVNFEWRYSKYKKGGEYLAIIFFENWLNVKGIPYDRKKLVNTSLSLSEVELISQLRGVYNNGIKILTNRLSKLSKSQKAKDDDLEQFYFQICSHYLSERNVEIDQINIAFQMEELLKTYEVSTYDKNTDLEYELKFSKDQIHVVTNTIDYLNSFKGKLFVFRSYIISKLPKFVLKMFGGGLKR